MEFKWVCFITENNASPDIIDCPLESSLLGMGLPLLEREPPYTLQTIVTPLFF